MKLSDCCLKIGSGATPHGGKESYLESGPFSLIRCQNVHNHLFLKTGLAFISDEQAKQLQNVDVQKDDVLLSITGSVARVCQVPDDVLPARVSQHVAIIRPDPAKLIHKFLHYFLVNPKMQSHMLNLSSAGGTRNALTKGMIESFEIPSTPLAEQKAIASVLGALDDKIENNRRMNETLEEMAQAIFKSWFVDFDPVHAKAAGNTPAHMDADTTALFPSSFGNDGLPVGWEEVSAEAISSITIGKTPPRKEHHWFSNSDDDIKWASIRDMGECSTYIFQTAEMLTKEAVEKFNVRVVPKNTVILSFKLTIGRVALTDESMATNEAIAHFGQLDSKYGAIQPEYLYAYLKEFNFNKLGNTSSIGTAVNSKTIKAMPIMLAGNSCREAFQKVMLPFLDKIKANLRENQTLAELRDTLLPKLMSGEIRVKDAERQVKEAV